MNGPGNFAIDELGYILLLDMNDFPRPPGEFACASNAPSSSRHGERTRRTRHLDGGLSGQGFVRYFGPSGRPWIANFGFRCRRAN